MIKTHDISKYTMESMEHFKLLEKLSKKHNKKLNVLIRLTSNNQFGVNEEEFKEIIKKNKNLIIDGIEYFSGTQKTSLKKINREIDYIYDFVNSIEEELDFKINEIEYGLGLPVYYFQEEEFDEDKFLEEVNNSLEKLRNKRLLIELGRSISASCGSYITSVADIKKNKNGYHVILDGGINHLVYYGQTMAMRIPYFEQYPKRNNNKEIYTLYGSLCTINDIILKSIELNKLEIGDYLVFKNTGAYSMTEGISLFLSRELPAVLIIDRDDNIKLVRNHLKTSDLNYPNYN
jgi:diaminopimelate decarboxylase